MHTSHRIPESDSILHRVIHFPRLGLKSVQDIFNTCNSFQDESEFDQKSQKKTVCAFMNLEL